MSDRRWRTTKKQTLMNKVCPDSHVVGAWMPTAKKKVHEWTTWSNCWSLETFWMTKYNCDVLPETPDGIRLANKLRCALTGFSVSRSSWLRSSKQWHPRGCVHVLGLEVGVHHLYTSVVKRTVWPQFFSTLISDGKLIAKVQSTPGVDAAWKCKGTAVVSLSLICKQSASKELVFWLRACLHSRFHATNYKPFALLTSSLGKLCFLGF